MQLLVKKRKKAQNNATPHSPNLHGDAWIVHLCIHPVGNLALPIIFGTTKFSRVQRALNVAFQWARTDFQGLRARGPALFKTLVWTHS